MLLLEYYDQLDDRLEDYLITINENQWRPIKYGPFHATVVEDVGIDAQNTNVTATRMKKEENNKRCIRELGGALPLVFYNYIHDCKTTQEIRNTLNKNFQGNE